MKFDTSRNWFKILTPQIQIWPDCGVCNTERTILKMGSLLRNITAVLEEFEINLGAIKITKPGNMGNFQEMVGREVSAKETY